MLVWVVERLCAWSYRVDASMSLQGSPPCTCMLLPCAAGCSHNKGCGMQGHMHMQCICRLPRLADYATHAVASGFAYAANLEFLFEFNSMHVAWLTMSPTNCLNSLQFYKCYLNNPSKGEHHPLIANALVK